MQGIGAGGLLSLALAIIGDIVPPRERARYQGYFLAVFGTSSVLGPVLGGFFAGADTILGIAGWRWIFYINVPIGIGRADRGRPRCCTSRTPAATTASTGPARCALIVGLVPLLIVAEQGRDWGWDSGRVAGLLRHRRGRPGRVHPGRAAVRATRRCCRCGCSATGPFAIGSASSLILGMGMFGGILLLPLYLQIVKGDSPDRGRPATAAAGARHHDRLDRLRPDHLPHRPLPDLPDHRHRADGGRRCCCSRWSARTRRCGRRC